MGARARDARRTAALVLAALAAVPAAGAPERRGPLESRDEFLLAQPRLMLPALSPDPLPPGRTRLRLAGDWGNDFGLRLVLGRPEPLLLIDGEHATLAAELRHGVSERLSLEARLPLRWRGGGVLDGIIDAWHDLTGLPDSGRPLLPGNRLRVEGDDTRGGRLDWTGRAGAGPGNLELAVHWALARPGGGAWSAALVGRMELPTALGPFGGAGAHAGAQVLAARALWGAADVYVGAGGTVSSSTRMDGLQYERARGHGFLALEWRPGGAVSLLAELSAATRLVNNLRRLPGSHVYLRLGAKVDVAEGWRLEGGFTEGLHRIVNTTDFGVMLGLERRF